MSEVTGERPTFRTRGGRTMVGYGDTTLLTMDRLAEFERRADSDPRIATLSLQPSALATDAWLRATAPAGPFIAVAQDAAALAGPLPTDDAALADWCLAASERGLWHDWWLTNHRDVARATALLPITPTDDAEAHDPSSAHFTDAYVPTRGRTGLTVTVDGTWLGPHETGAQVLTVAAIDAMARDPRIDSITIDNLTELPAYATRLLTHPKVHLAPPDEPSALADVVWVPNQIDGRSSVADARKLGRRVVATYLDLIAYDIPRYHATPEAWAAYRALQRRVALSVDGITTISADVAHRLLDETPRLDPARVKPIVLGLDHITAEQAPTEPGADIAQLAKALDGRRFVVVLGNDFLHKNRDFAIKVWERILQSGIACDLVLAGLHVKSSSSKATEDALLAKVTDLRGRVHSVGHVSSASRSWLLANAAAALYPSSAEGFGFVPYEAAALGTPTTFADFGPLAEVAQVPGLPQRWQVDAFAADLARLLTDDTAAKARVADLQQAVTAHTWTGFADALIAHFELVLAAPTVLTSTVLEDESAANQLAAVLSSRTFRIAQRLQRLKPGRK